MALAVGTNSYISAANADLYFADYLGADAWTGATAADRDKALIAATRRIDRLSLVGKKKEEAQALQFPRCYLVGTRPLEYPATFDLLLKSSTEDWECQAVVPRSVLDAVCEEALAILSGKTVSKRAQLQREGVTSTRVGRAAETYSGVGAIQMLASMEAGDYLRPYVANPGAFG